MTTAETLDLTGVTFGYVTENGQIAADGTWTAAVTVTWRIDGFERTSARADVQFAFADGGDRIDAIGGGADQRPVWLHGSVAADRTEEVAVLVADGVVPLGPLVEDAEEALVAARRVLGPRARRVVIEVPASVADLHAALGAAPGTYDRIAAVTASADGSNVPGRPIHVFVNPEEFAGLDRLAAQVVISHETAHAVTRAPDVRAEPWLLEGFADYVALRDVDLPLARTAGQVLDQVSERGVPGSLPSRADFDGQAPHLGAAYESAWLVCVTLADHGGEEALVGFYDAVVGGADLEEELGARFGWSLQDLTTAWQDRLRALAGAGG